MGGGWAGLGVMLQLEYWLVTGDLSRLAGVLRAFVGDSKMMPFRAVATAGGEARQGTKYLKKLPDDIPNGHNVLNDSFSSQSEYGMSTAKARKCEGMSTARETD